MKKGLVLEGGAMRGIFTAGVMDVFMENGITFDGAIGVSAGAIFGSNYKSNQPGRVIRYNKKYCRYWRYCSFRSALFTGNMFGADFCYRKIPYELDIFDVNAYNKNPMDFYMVVTDVATGKPEYHKCNIVDENFFKWMRASGSMPLVSRIVEIDGKKYLDGAIGDSIPLEFFENIGYDRNITILTQPKGFVKKPSSGILLAKLMYHGYPAFVKAFTERYILYNEELRHVEESENSGKTLVIRPLEPLPMNRISNDPDELQITYDIGRNVGLQNLMKVKEFLDIK